MSNTKWCYTLTGRVICCDSKGVEIAEMKLINWKGRELPWYFDRLPKSKKFSFDTLTDEQKQSLNTLRRENEIAGV